MLIDQAKPALANQYSCKYHHQCVYNRSSYLHRSNVIEHITAQYGTRKEIGVSFVYYDYKKPELGDPSRVIAALIKQLCRRKERIPSDLLKFKRDSLRPSFESLQGLFTSLADSFQHCFLIIDALDECPSVARHQILGFFSNVLPHVKIFITSRKEDDISLAFEEIKAPIIKIEAGNVAEDIESFVSSEVKQLRKGYNGKKMYLSSNSPEETVIRTLTNKAEGM